MEAIYTQAVAVLLGILSGLWLRRVAQTLVILIALAGIAALVLILTGRGAMLEGQHNLMPQALTLGSQAAVAVRQLLVSSPGMLAGLLVGALIRELVVLAKS